MIKKMLLCLSLAGALLLSACGSNAEGSSMEAGDDGEVIQAVTDLEKIDMTRWQYNEETDVYWQTGILYCENPADENYENLGIYVPGDYMDGNENEDGTYTCEIDPSGTVGGFTAGTAPIVIPVDTPGYAAMNAPTGYVDSVSDYTDAGFIYVYAGCRGRDAGAPAGVTDLKAAVRYLRYNDGVVPGSVERIFSFGMSGGGAQSALVGSTGDSELYTPYLEAIGAVSGVSDAVAGSMCWCPITNLDYASEAYEWNLGVTRTGLTEELQELSDQMAEQFALYINELELKDENGDSLLLTASEEGIYQAGSYYDYLKTVVETSLNHFLEDTTFPYTASGSGSFGGRGGFGDFDGPDGEIDENAEFGGPGGETDENTEFGGPGGETDGNTEFGGPGGEIDGNAEFGDFGGKGTIDGQEEGLEIRGGKGGQNFKGNIDDEELQDGEMTDFPGSEAADLPDGGTIEMPDGEIDGERQVRDGFGGENGFYEIDGIDRNETAGGLQLSGTYETVQDYIDALNAENEWVTYDSASNTVSITSIADFVSAFKIASKDLGAFDALDESQGENILFGDGDGSGDHFDPVMAELLTGTEYAEEFASDLLRTDALGTSVADRVNMYTPLYYLTDYYEGYGTANVASYWRIRSGINQSDTALTTEVNLALALENYGADVDFETVWGQAHVEAERTGSSTANFIEWVTECCK